MRHLFQIHFMFLLFVAAILTTTIFPCDATAKLKAGIYPGSFDPAHLAHKEIVELSIRTYGLDIVYVIPDLTTEYKPEMRPIHQRIEMSQLLFEDLPKVKVLSEEMIPLLGDGNLWNVIDGIQSLHSDGELHVIMGTDTLAWYQELDNSFKRPGTQFIVNKRDPSYSIPSIVDGGHVRTITTLRTGVSSTAIRKALATGELTPDLPERVREYIEKNGLYGFKSSLESVAERLFNEGELASLPEVNTLLIEASGLISNCEQILEGQTNNSIPAAE